MRLRRCASFGFVEVPRTGGVEQAVTGSMWSPVMGNSSLDERRSADGGRPSIRAAMYSRRIEGSSYSNMSRAALKSIHESGWGS
jgi:hypothetical protein